MSEFTSRRFASLDIFRGLTICFMIIVNMPGNDVTTFAPLMHASWHGFTPTDLVFPSFLFAVGMSLYFSSEKWKDMTHARIVTKIAKRTLIIFILGFLMYWFPFFTYADNGALVIKPFETTRIMGVLQRIALTYGIVALLVCYVDRKRLIHIGIALLAMYWLALLGFARHGADPYSIYGNAVLRLDNFLLGSSHLYHESGPYPFDPEGILSTIPALVNVIAGFLTVSFIKKQSLDADHLLRLSMVGLLLILIAYFWNFSFPVNKKLWTSSFVLLSVGLDLLLLTPIIYFTELKQRKRWGSFFMVFGRNPLFLYLFSELLATLLFTFHLQTGENYYEWCFNHISQYFTPYLGSLLQAIVYMLLCWCVGKGLEKNNIYIKI